MDAQTLADCERILRALHNAAGPIGRRGLQVRAGGDWLPSGRFARAIDCLDRLGLVEIGTGERSWRIRQPHALNELQTTRIVTYAKNRPADADEGANRAIGKGTR